MLHEHKRSHISSQDVLRLLIKDVELSDSLARQLEIEVDPGESPGAYLRDSCQAILDDGKQAYAHRLLAEVNHD
ncbi:hypothetical protein ACUN7Z_00765 [Vreelandella venusta]|uniref:hypothetical protein n=1 Tax=Vreelandella venusta TaxID=44935 RepID=UPI004043F9E1